jgi:hypothetical protein
MTAPVQEPTPGREVSGLGYGSRQLFRRPAPATAATSADWAMLAIPDGQTVTTSSLDVVVNYNRADVNGTALDVNPTTGLVTINEEGVYDIHTWAEWDDQGTWTTVEGPVFQGGQDYQDIGNGLHVHVSATYIAATIMQHKTTLFAVEVGGNLSPTGFNLQVAHNRGTDDDVFNAGITVVKIGDYPSTGS